MQKLAGILLKTEPTNVRVLEVVRSQQPSEFCRLGKSNEQVSLHAEEFSVDSKSDLERAIVEKLNSRWRGCATNDAHSSKNCHVLFCPVHCSYGSRRRFGVGQRGTRWRPSWYLWSAYNEAQEKSFGRSTRRKIGR